MADLDLGALFERAVLNGLSNPDPVIRQRNALRVPTDAHAGPAVRAELARLAGEDPSAMVRTACADAVAFLESDTAAIGSRLAEARRGLEPSRVDRLLRWLRAQFTVLVPEPAAGSGPWPFFGPLPEAVDVTQAPPAARLEVTAGATEITFWHLPASFEGSPLRVLLLSAAEGEWLESAEPVADGAARVTLARETADARELGDIWISPGQA